MDSLSSGTPSMTPTWASYGYARITYANDKESQREKFILIVWIGSGCKVMRKAKVGLSFMCDAACIYQFVSQVWCPFFP